MGEATIRISGGRGATAGASGEVLEDNTGSFVLDLDRLSWRREG